MGKSTRVRCPSEETGPVSLDGAATAAAHQPRLGEEGLTKPLPIAEEPGKQQRSPAAAAMRAGATAVMKTENDNLGSVLWAPRVSLPVTAVSRRR